MKIKMYRPDNCIYEKEKVEEFIERIDILISKIPPDMDISELDNFKQLILLNKSYDNKDVWFIDSIEEKLNKYEEDLPF